MIRIQKELKGIKIGEFSKLKILQGPNFEKMRNHFTAKLLKMFICPAYTFDNVNGKFPIGFKIWDTEQKEIFKETKTDIFDEDGKLIGKKKIRATGRKEVINIWIKKYDDKEGIKKGFLQTITNDFQNNIIVHIRNTKDGGKRETGNWIDENNLIPCCIYLAVRKCIPATWINDREQFLTPNNKWQTDTEFQNDCLVFALFHAANVIKSEMGTNHFIPFTEEQVGAAERFDSNFMSQFIAGKLKDTRDFGDMFQDGHLKQSFVPTEKLWFSEEAEAVFDAGLEIWKYYHQQKNSNVNASLYDIKVYFQGRNQNGKMNNKSEDETYTALMEKLKQKMENLRMKLQPKVYDYGFLKK